MRTISVMGSGGDVRAPRIKRNSGNSSPIEYSIRGFDMYTLYTVVHERTYTNALFCGAAAERWFRVGSRS